MAEMEGCVSAWKEEEGIGVKERGRKFAGK